jgi:hypothetical protein
LDGVPAIESKTDEANKTKQTAITFIPWHKKARELIFKLIFMFLKLNFDKKIEFKCESGIHSNFPPSASGSDNIQGFKLCVQLVNCTFSDLELGNKVENYYW